MPTNSGQGIKTPETFRVLVVDDSPSIRRRVVQRLEAMNFHMTEASSVLTPLPETEKLRRLLASPLRISLIAILRSNNEDRFNVDKLSRKTGRLRSSRKG